MQHKYCMLSICYKKENNTHKKVNIFVLILKFEDKMQINMNGIILFLTLTFKD